MLGGALVEQYSVSPWAMLAGGLVIGLVVAIMSYLNRLILGIERLGNQASLLRGKVDRLESKFQSSSGSNWLQTYWTVVGPQVIRKIPDMMDKLTMWLYPRPPVCNRSREHAGRPPRQDREINMNDILHDQLEKAIFRQHGGSNEQEQDQDQV